MNKNRIFAIFILIALLITCVGVSFASNDFDDAYMDDDSIDDDLKIDDSDLEDISLDDMDDNDDLYLDDEDDNLEDEDWYLDDDAWEDSDDEDFDLDDEDWEEYDLDDEDWEDDDWDDDDWDLDDEDWDDWDDEDWDDDDWDLDDEDWDDWDDDDWDDDDWDDEDFDLDDEDWDDEELDWFEEGNFTEGGRLYYYHVMAYKNGKALGCAYSAPNCDDSDSESDNETVMEKDTAFAAGCCGENSKDSSLDTYIAKTTNTDYDSIAKTIDLGDLKDAITPDDSKNTSKKNTINNLTNAVEANDDMGIFAFFALLLVSLIVLI